MGQNMTHAPESLALGAVRTILATMSTAGCSDKDRLEAITYALAQYGFARFIPGHKRTGAFDAYLTVDHEVKD